jgi:hypothetical protein
LPDCAVDAVNDSVPEVAPGTGLKDDPELVLTIHCTVGEGSPFAAAVNVAVLVFPTELFIGLSVIDGIEVTLNNAAVVVAFPAVLVNTASKSLPSCVELTMKDNVVDVAPATAEYDEPPFVLTIHCTVGVGVPLAAAEKVAVLPALVDTFEGLVLMAGMEPVINGAGVLVALPIEFVNTASYRFPFIAGVTVKVKVYDVAPAIGV